jgi:hypothetical protein
MNPETKQTLESLLAGLRERQQKASRNAHAMRQNGDGIAARYYDGQFSAYQYAIQAVEALLDPQRVTIEPVPPPPGSYHDPRTGLIGGPLPD